MYGGVDGVSAQINQWKGNWLFIGEWSLGTPGSAPFNDDAKFKQFADRYTKALNNCHSGWTYWTWKTSNDENSRQAWSLRSLLKRGLFNIQPNEAVE